jgi:glyceraldehyde 3-phosphate dehydrogenase
MEKKTTVGINGFGRIGRNLFRLLLNHPSIAVVAVNDLADTKTLSHLLKYDSIHGVLKEEISHSENEIIIAGKKVKFSS